MSAVSLQSGMINEANPDPRRATPSFVNPRRNLVAPIGDVGRITTIGVPGKRVRRKKRRYRAVRTGVVAPGERSGAPAPAGFLRTAPCDAAESFLLYTAYPSSVAGSGSSLQAVSYTHLTLPTICSV